MTLLLVCYRKKKRRKIVQEDVRLFTEAEEGEVPSDLHVEDTEKVKGEHEEDEIGEKVGLVTYDEQLRELPSTSRVTFEKRPGGDEQEAEFSQTLHAIAEKEPDVDEQEAEFSPTLHAIAEKKPDVDEQEAEFSPTLHAIAEKEPDVDEQEAEFSPLSRATAEKEPDGDEQEAGPRGTRAKDGTEALIQGEGTEHKALVTSDVKQEEESKLDEKGKEHKKKKKEKRKSHVEERSIDELEHIVEDMELAKELNPELVKEKRDRKKRKRSRNVGSMDESSNLDEEQLDVPAVEEHPLKAPIAQGAQTKKDTQTLMEAEETALEAAVTKDVKREEEAKMDEKEKEHKKKKRTSKSTVKERSIEALQHIAEDMELNPELVKEKRDRKKRKRSRSRSRNVGSIDESSNLDEEQLDVPAADEHPLKAPIEQGAQAKKDTQTLMEAEGTALDTVGTKDLQQEEEAKMDEKEKRHKTKKKKKRTSRSSIEERPIKDDEALEYIVEDMEQVTELKPELAKKEKVHKKRKRSSTRNTPTAEELPLQTMESPGESVASFVKEKKYQRGEEKEERE